MSSSLLFVIILFTNFKRRSGENGKKLSQASQFNFQINELFQEIKKIKKNHFMLEMFNGYMNVL